MNEKHITKEVLEALAADPNTSVQQSAWDAVPCPSVACGINGWFLVSALGLENPTVGQEFVGLLDQRLGVKSLIFARRFRIDEIKGKNVISVRGPEDMTVLNAPTKTKMAVKLTQVA